MTLLKRHPAAPALAMAIGMTLLMSLAAGCMAKSGQADPPALAASAQSPAAAKTAAALDAVGGGQIAAGIVAAQAGQYFVAGLGLIVIGGFAFAVGGRASGLALMLIGGVTGGLGVLYIRYPWFVLLIALATAALMAVEAYGRWQAGRALADSEGAKARTVAAMKEVVAAVESADGGEEVKAVIKADGPATVAVVRAVVDPLKSELAREGRIGGIEE